MTNSTTRLCTCGSSKSEWRAYLSQARYCVKKLSSCTRRCMVQNQVSLEVQDGNGGSARGMEYATCPLNVRNYLLIQKQVQLLSHLSMNLLKSTSLLSIKFSIVMRLDLTFACCEQDTSCFLWTLCWWKKAEQRESHNQCLCKCYRHHQITAPGYRKSKTSNVF